MQFHSTVNNNSHYDFITAMQTGLADDGGLYVPDYLPRIALKEFSTHLSYAEFAAKLLHHFIDQPLQAQLSDICTKAFNFPVPLTAINRDTWMLELFHGPTLSFKDFGARFLAECLQRIHTTKPITILVATSGDTGSAVAAAFYQKSPIHVMVLFPQGKISTRQQQQITCWQDNVLAIAVDGTFDDCQRLVKSAFHNPWWQENTMLSTANSINIGRLLPQIVYYAYSSYHFQHKYNTSPGFIIPSGNLGNVTAAFWAKAMGFPIREIVIATNANPPLTHYLATGHFQAFATQTTLANAMDVGNPSNFARLQDLFPQYQQFKSEVKAFLVNDTQICQAITQAYHNDQVVICPHTATAYYLRQQLDANPWIVVSTAHPCKFEKVIEPILQIDIPPTNELASLLDRPQHYVSIPAELAALTREAGELLKKTL